MFGITSIPSWEALHPALSHFPIVLLMVAPLFVVLALVLAAHRRTLMLVALGLLVAGTVAVYLSASTGDEAKKTAPQTPEVMAAIDRHETLGATVRVLATALSALLAALLFGPRLLKREVAPRTFSLLAVVLLVISLAAVVLVIGAAHSGGLLVHKLGVHAPLS